MKPAKNNRQETFFTLTGTCTHKNEKTEQINLQQYYYILFAVMFSNDYYLYYSNYYNINLKY